MLRNEKLVLVVNQKVFAVEVRSLTSAGISNLNRTCNDFSYFLSYMLVYIIFKLNMTRY